MRIAGLLTLYLTTACVGNRVATLDASRSMSLDAVRLTTPDSARLLAPDTHGLIVRLPTSKASVRPRCFDCGPHVSAPYLMIIDGTTYRFPEDSARILRDGKQFQPSVIESLDVIAGEVATERYHSAGRPVILIKIKQAAKR
ncbi:MAG: hypothetical protein ACJ796_04950 [Gemmatimonadaceae bacterium]